MTADHRGPPAPTRNRRSRSWMRFSAPTGRNLEGLCEDPQRHAGEQVAVELLDAGVLAWLRLDEILGLDVAVSGHRRDDALPRKLRFDQELAGFGPVDHHAGAAQPLRIRRGRQRLDRKSTRLNSSHPSISYAVFCLKK